MNMRMAGKWLVRVFAAMGVVATAGILAFVAGGPSARPEPSRAEATVARAARHLLIPAAAKRSGNPLARSDELLASARAHWADHCASCHGNDGKGQTAMGRNLYPRAPDMTLAATQELSDGELFWIIENGVKLSGMPAWGKPELEDDAATWELVHFIRRLPTLTEAELAAMTRFNPVSRAALEEELEMERFLAGEDAPMEAHGKPDHNHH